MRDLNADNEVPFILKWLAQPYSDRCIIGDLYSSILKPQSHKRTSDTSAIHILRLSFKAPIPKPT